MDEEVVEHIRNGALLSHRQERLRIGSNEVDGPRAYYRVRQVRKRKIILHAAAAKSLQSCLTLRDPIDGSPPGSPVPRILQARTREWVAISFPNA